jgi:hypothetical protein
MVVLMADTDPEKNVINALSPYPKYIRVGKVKKSIKIVFFIHPYRILST